MLYIHIVYNMYIIYNIYIHRYATIYYIYVLYMHMFFLTVCIMSAADPFLPDLVMRPEYIFPGKMIHVDLFGKGRGFMAPTNNF